MHGLRDDSVVNNTCYSSRGLKLVLALMLEEGPHNELPITLAPGNMMPLLASVSTCMHLYTYIHDIYNNIQT